jgi:hypothetical protein
MHATSYLTYFDTSVPASRSTSVSWQEWAQRQTYQLVQEQVNYTTSRTTSASGSRITYWTTAWDVPYSYYSSYTTYYDTWAPGSTPYYSTYSYTTCRWTHFKFEDEYETCWDVTRTTIAGYYNEWVPTSRATSVLVSGSNHYEQSTSAVVGYTTYYDTSWNVSYTSSYYQYYNTDYLTTYSSSYTTNYTSTWQTSRSTSRDTTW